MIIGAGIARRATPLGHVVHRLAHFILVLSIVAAIRARRISRRMARARLPAPTPTAGTYALPNRIEQVDGPGRPTRDGPRRPILRRSESTFPRDQDGPVQDPHDAESSCSDPTERRMAPHEKRIVHAITRPGLDSPLAKARS